MVTRFTPTQIAAGLLAALALLAPLHAQTTRTWTGAGANANASTPENWSDSTAPVSGDHIVFDNAHLANPWTNVLWNLEIEPASWLQTAEYAGTVTFQTRYPGFGSFSNLVIAGNCVLSNGVWTHPANTGVTNATDRLAARIDGDFTLGTGALVSVSGRGYAIGRGPGAGATGQRSTSGAGASHGGQGAWGNAGGTPPPTYGSFTRPAMLGSGGDAVGGGAVWLSVGGTAMIAGSIVADGFANGQRAGGSGGSILLEADALTGTGLLRARGGGLSYLPGGGGRVAVILRASDTFGNTGFLMQAHGHTRGYGDGIDSRSAAGTVYRESPAGRQLTIDNSLNPVTATNVYTMIPAELEIYDPPAAVTSELAAVSLSAPDGAQAHIRLADSVRMKTLDRLGANSTLDLYSFTLYFTAAEPVDFPDLSTPSTEPTNAPAALGGGTIWPNGGRILWNDQDVTMPFLAWAGPNGSIANYDPDGLYDYLSSVTVTAVPATGHAFLRWLGAIPEGEDPFDPALTLTIVPELHVRAVFASTAANTRTWIGGGSDTLASTATNWFPAGAPPTGDHIILNDASFNQYAWDTGIVDLFERWDAWLAHSVNLNWNLEIEPASWTQSEWYTGTVTIPTRFPDWGTFTNFAIQGDCTLLNGTWTYPANSGNTNETDRLAVSVAGHFTLGANAVITATGRGYAATRGPGAGNTAQRASTGYGASHGGQGGYGTNALPATTYGSYLSPTNLGSGANAPGGGAVLLNIAGAAAIDGQILADGTSVTDQQPSGAGGSILLRAAALTGSGRLQARGSLGGFQVGGGGRIAVLLAGNAGFENVVFDASGNVRVGDDASTRSAAGTVYLESGAGGPNRQGVLRIDNRNIDTTPGRVRTLIPSGLATPDCPPVCLEGTHVLLTITNRGEAALNTSLRMRDLSVSTNSPTLLHLQGHTLYLRASYHDDWGHEDHVVYDGGAIVWTPRGTLIIIR